MDAVTDYIESRRRPVYEPSYILADELITWPAETPHGKKLDDVDVAINEYVDQYGHSHEFAVMIGDDIRCRMANSFPEYIVRRVDNHLVFTRKSAL